MIDLQSGGFRDIDPELRADRYETLTAGEEAAYPRTYDLFIVDEAYNVAPSGRGQYATESMRTLATAPSFLHFEGDGSGSSFLDVPQPPPPGLSIRRIVPVGTWTLHFPGNS